MPRGVYDRTKKKGEAKASTKTKTAAAPKAKAAKVVAKSSTKAATAPKASYALTAVDRLSVLGANLNGLVTAVQCIGNLSKVALASLETEIVATVTAIGAQRELICPATNGHSTNEVAKAASKKAEKSASPAAVPQPTATPFAPPPPPVSA